MKPTAEMIKAQKELVNSIDFDSERERFEAEFDKLSEMRSAAADPVVLDEKWCTTDGEWWA